MRKRRQISRTQTQSQRKKISHIGRKTSFNWNTVTEVQVPALIRPITTLNQDLWHHQQAK